MADPAIQAWTPSISGPIRLSKYFFMTLKATGLRLTNSIQVLDADGTSRWFNATLTDTGSPSTRRIDTQVFMNVRALGAQAITVIAYGLDGAPTATASATVQSRVPSLSPTLTVTPNPSKGDVTLTANLTAPSYYTTSDFGFGDGSTHVKKAWVSHSATHHYARSGHYTASLDVARPYQRLLTQTTTTLTKFSNQGSTILVLPLGVNLSLVYWDTGRGIHIVDGYVIPIPGQNQRIVGRIIDHTNPLSPVIGPEQTLARVLSDSAQMQSCSLVVLSGHRILSVWAGFQTAWGYRKRYQVTAYSGVIMTPEGTGGDLPARDGHIDTQFDTDNSWTAAFGLNSMPMGAVSARRVLMTNREADTNVEYYGVEYVLMELPVGYSGQAVEISTGVGTATSNGWRSSSSMQQVGPSDFLNVKAGSALARVRVVDDLIIESAFLDGAFGGPVIKVLSAESKWWKTTKEQIAEIDLSGTDLALVNPITRQNTANGTVAGFMRTSDLAVECITGNVGVMGESSGNTTGFRTFNLAVAQDETFAIDRQDLLEDGTSTSDMLMVGADHVIVPVTTNAFTPGIQSYTPTQYIGDGNGFSTTSSVSLVVPGGIQAGDFLLVTGAAWSNSSETDLPGYTPAGQNGHTRIFTRIADGTESGTTITMTNGYGAGDHVLVMQVFRGPTDFLTRGINEAFGTSDSALIPNSGTGSGTWLALYSAFVYVASGGPVVNPLPDTLNAVGVGTDTMYLYLATKEVTVPPPLTSTEFIPITSTIGGEWDCAVMTFPSSVFVGGTGTIRLTSYAPDFAQEPGVTTPVDVVTLAFGDHANAVIFE